MFNTPDNWIECAFRPDAPRVELPQWLTAVVSTILEIETPRDSTSPDWLVALIEEIGQRVSG